MKEPKRIYARFFRTETGNEPVRQWLMELDKVSRQIIGTDIKDVEYAWPVGLPLCRPIKGHSPLREVRSDLPNGTIARVLFYIRGDQMILLHGFIKKTEKTPQKELEIAQKRRKEHELGAQ